VNKAVFLDRDGTVSEEIGYISAKDMDKYALVAGSAEGMRKLKAAGFKLLLTTNQSGVGRGYYPVEQVHAVHARLEHLLSKEKVSLDGIYFCPHHPDGDCACRKPRPGMPLQAAAEWDLDLKSCWVVGDKPADVEMAAAAGCRGILVLTGFGRESLAELRAAGHEPEFVAADLKEAAEIILKS